MFRKTSFFLAALLCSALALSAQTDSPKYGHIDLGNLLDGLPETKSAEDSLKVFAAQLSIKDSVMTMAFQEAYLLLQKQYQARELTAVRCKSARVNWKNNVRKYRHTKKKPKKTWKPNAAIC